MHESEDVGRDRDHRRAGASPVAAQGVRRGGARRELVLPAAPVAEPTGVLAALARHWPSATALVLLGTAAGCGWAWRTPDVHTAETRLSVGSQELSAQAVPGYAFALTTLTSNYARYVETTDSVRADLAASLGASARTVSEVTASPIPESNILRIEVEATDPAVAVQAADLVGSNLTAELEEGSSGAEAEREQLVRASEALAAAEQQQRAAEAALASLPARAAQAEVDAARKLVTDAATAVDVLTVEQEASSTTYRTALEDSGKSTSLSVIRPAEITRDDGTSSLQRWGALGAMAGTAAAVGMALVLDRARRRRHRRAAAGARTDHAGPLVAGDVPAQLVS